MGVDILIFFIQLSITLTLMGIEHYIATRPKVESSRPPALGDFTFPTATEGRVIPLLFGTVIVKAPNVVWYGDLKSVAITESAGSNTQTIGFKYYLGVQFGLCMGQVDGLLNIYVNSTLVWSGWQDTDGQFNIVAGRVFGGFGGGGSGGIGALPSAPNDSGQFFFYVGQATPTANAYLQSVLGLFLWQDNFSLGNADESLNNFQGSDPGQWYQISKGTTNSTSITLNPTAADFDDDIMQTYPGTESGDLTPTHVAMMRLPFPNVPDYTDISYVAVLTNPNAPQLDDEFVTSMIFRPRVNLTGISGGFGDTIWFGVMVDGTSSPTSKQGIFATIQHDNTINLIIQDPSGTVLFSQTFTSTGDFPLLDNGAANLWGIAIEVEGDTVTLGVYGGITIANYLKPLTTATTYQLYRGQPVSGLHSLLTGCTGVCIGGEANFNSPNFIIGTGAVDYSDPGIYALTIDTIDRNVVIDYPAWPGISYGVFQKGYIGTSTTPPPWAFEMRRCPNGLSLSGGMELVNANGHFADANPANIIYEMITDPDWGLSLNSATIDTTNFTAVATVLFNEGNGFSILIDSTVSISDFLAELERQIYGYVFINSLSGLWNITLIRGGYDPTLLPVINDSNVVEVQNFNHGTWDETTNNVRVAFSDRGNQYSDTYAQAQDMANVAIQGAVITSTSNYPGVKDVNLANQIAWRDLRLLSTPLAVATLVVGREFSSTQVGDVIVWTDSDRNITSVPMRVISVNLGKLEDGKVILNLTQDIYYTPVPSFAPPGDSQWTPPLVPPSNIEDTSRNIFEAPYAMDRLFGSSVINKIYSAAIATDGAAQFDVWTSDNGDTYSDVATVTTFAQEGKLSSSVNVVPNGGNIAVVADQSTYGQIIAILQSGSSSFVGSTLTNLILIDNEFMLFTGFSGDGSTTITLQNVWRGVMDTSPAAHASNAPVWFLFGGLTSQTYAVADDVNVKIVPQNVSGPANLGLVTASLITMQGRATFPYPPANLNLNGTVFPSTTSLNVPQTDHTESFYNRLAAPTTTSSTAGTATLGAYFSVSANGWLTGISVYFGVAYSSNTITMDLWTNGGTKLVEAASPVTTLSAPGWVTVLFPNPVYLQSSTTYVASYTPTSSLSQTSHTSEFSSPVTVGDITIAHGATVASSGTPVFPTSTGSTSYEISPLFIKESLQSLDAYGLSASWIRRDYRNTNETSAYSESSLPTDFPATNGTEYNVAVFNDPLGANTNIINTSYFNGNSAFYSLAQIIKTAAVVPSELGVSIGTKHFYPQVSGGTLQTASQNLKVDTSITTNLGSLHAYGVLVANTGSGTYTATSTGTFTLHIGTALSTGAVEVSVNGGGYISVIASSLTTGTFSVTSGQTIAIKSTQSGMSNVETFMLMTDGNGLQVAWAVLDET